MFNPRPTQAPVVAYQAGKMGVSAVPGSGKTTTLSMLAFRLIAEGKIGEDQEILIVTLVNSAVDNFNARIQDMLHEARLIPSGFRVRTLHGLANDIVRQKPELAGLDNQYMIADERIQTVLLQDATRKWIRLHPEVIMDLTSESHSLQNTNVRSGWQNLMQEIAVSFIRQAKDMGVSPEDVRSRMEEQGWQDQLLQMGLDIYTDYQQGLKYHGAVDFDDLISKALQVISTDAGYLAELQERWPYILEDEAQDSSRLQEDILRKLSSRSGNWVRVGDPNQAIYETFTTASPEYLIRFMQQPDVVPQNLPESSRSTASIIHLANDLITWTNTAHPNPRLRSALRKPYIQLTSQDDPHPNPDDNPGGIHLFDQKLAPEKELTLVVNSVKKWLPDHGEDTVALLVPSNPYGEQLVEELKKQGVPYHEILRSSANTRTTVNLFVKILEHLSKPERQSTLADMFEAIYRFKSPDHELLPLESDAERYLRRLHNPEKYLWPKPGQEVLEEFQTLQDKAELEEVLADFRQILQRWHQASLLPIDQLILVIAMDLFTEMADLALAYKVAQRLEWAAMDNPQYTLPDYISMLKPITGNKESFSGFDLKDTGFDPSQYKGKAVVSTYHKAKGLEWDRVHLLSVNNFDFPSGDAGDFYVAEKFFVSSQRNLQAETLASLSSLMVNQAGFTPEGDPTAEARLNIAAERLRLLFVGITRAKKELILTWNTGKRGNCQPALAFLALKNIHEQEQQ
ncbi:MAG TPA: ATP-dependent helicase [Anaerolineaceae bacterium]|nr:ATP-dependent helicase [Anaerolineaceae bacterium]